MKKTARGFTLVEVLITLLIIGVLSGLIYLALRPSEDMVKRKACEGNRSTILLALDAHRFSSGLTKAEYGLQSFIDEGYKNEIDNKETKCPAGGTYSAALSNGREIVVCSVHGGGPTGGGGEEPGGGGEEPSGGSSNIIPGSNDFGGDGVLALEDWNDPVWVDKWPGGSNAYISVEKDSKYYFDTPDGDREFYLSLYDGDVMFNANNRDEAGDVITTPDNLPSWTSSSHTGLVRFTGVSVNWDDLPEGYKLFRGDIAYYNGSYYVCIIGGNSSVLVDKSEYNSTHPESTKGGWAWYKISS